MLALVVEGSLLAASLAMLSVSLRMPASPLPGAVSPGTVPAVAFSALAAGCAWLLVKDLRAWLATRTSSAVPGAQPSEGEGQHKERHRLPVTVLAVVAAVAICAWLWQFGAFVPASIAFVGGVSWFLGRDVGARPLACLAVAIAAVGLFYVVFRVALGVPLPGL